MGVYGNSSLTPIYGQLAMSKVLWPIGPFWFFMAFGPYPLLLETNGPRPYPAIIGLWPILHLTNPQVNILVMGLGGNSSFWGPLDPLAITRALRTPPLIGGLWPLWPTVWGTWDLLGPFWPKSNEAKRGQGGSPLAPKAKWEHLSLFWPQIPRIPKWPKGPQDPQLAIINNEPHFQPMASGNHQRPPAQFWKDFPSIWGKTFPLFMDPVPNDPGLVQIWYHIPL
ncbi:hypothetical protein O181_056021 [Austropuccinia psidii MF-1]|uniref:Uncharacterized protein n=1 Tax=Austropuccinia psidii MF-1 TaxID=1389203 RepID=A0A9Q3ECH1_9BASI|nr:hypothetical protein [Austropuccinia psidii MF-1]